jgi:tricorn protease
MLSRHMARVSDDWSDRSGEYEIWLHPTNGTGEPRQLTERGKGFGYTLYWSPDSEKLSFIDETNTIYVVDVESGNTEEAGNTNWNVGHNDRFGYSIAWSPDSRWITFSQGLENSHSAIFIYDTEEDELRQATSGFYNDGGAVFGAEGKYLFLLTNRELDAAYSSLDDGTWIYPNTTKIAAVSLTDETPWLLEAKNDKVEMADSADEEQKSEEESEDENGNEQEQEEEMAVEIDFEGFESRLVLRPPAAGNLGGLIPFKGKLAYLRYPNTGSTGQPPALQYYDIEERKEETILQPVNDAEKTPDGEEILVQSEGRYAIISPNPSQKIEEPIPTDELEMDLVQREEWRQIFMGT